MLNQPSRFAFAAATAAAALLLAASSVSAQQKSPPKEPPIDLDDLARQPRPGTPAPKPAPAPEPAPAQAKPAPQPAPQPAPAPAPKPQPQPKPQVAAPAPAPAPAQPQPAPQPAPTRRDAPVDPLSALAAGVTREPAKLAIVKIQGDEGQVESRRVWTGASTFRDRWRAVTKSAEPALTLADFRTGLAGSVTLKVDDTTTATLGPLTRARVGRMNTGDSGPSATRVVIELLRGKVDITPAPGKSVNVVTPDGIVMVRESATVSHDAAKGTTTTPSGQGAATSR